MNLASLAAVFLGVASGLAGLISFISGRKRDPARRKKFYILLAVVFIVSIAITLATGLPMKQATGRKVAGTYIAHGSESRRIYFHNDADPESRRNAFISSTTEVYVLEVKNGFGYVDFRNTKGQVSTGWVEMKYLERKP